MDAREGDCVVMVTDAGRALRVSTDDIPTRGLQALNRVDDESVVGFCLARADEELLLVTTGGYARRLPVSAIPELTKPNMKGQVIISRKPVSGVTRVRPGHPLWVALSRELAPIDPDNVALERESTRSYRLRELGRGAEPLFLFSPG
jgi:DNA gyrase/topoisomerase IV subunit A